MAESLQSPLSAAAPTAASLLSGATFEVPIYQREYAWTSDEIEEFWEDLRGAVDNDSYFLGLLILTKEGKRYQVVDGQQRILTLTLLVAAIRAEAIKVGRTALAEKLRTDFLQSIDFETDGVEPRVVLSDTKDNETLQAIVEGRQLGELEDESVSQRIVEAYNSIHAKLKADVSSDAFRRLGLWTEFISTQLYFAVFIHPDAASAYKVFEAINTRGRNLTTAELLKNFVLSQTAKSSRKKTYSCWQDIAQQFQHDGANSFVQYIRHIITSRYGYVLPRDLFDLVAGKGAFAQKDRPSIPQLLEAMSIDLDLYLQMTDPSQVGPADQDLLSVFSALNALSVISVRPILLALFASGEGLASYQDLLRLVVRRIVVGNLGTGNVERRFGEVAKRIRSGEPWSAVKKDLADLNPDAREFRNQLSRRSLNKQTLTFIRRSVVQASMTPTKMGFFHLIRPKHATDWAGFTAESSVFWTNTIGNSFLANVERRVRGANTWDGFKELMLPCGVPGEPVLELGVIDCWDSGAVESVGQIIAQRAADVWY